VCKTGQEDIPCSESRLAIPLLLLLAAGCASSLLPLKTVDRVDLQRFMVLGVHLALQEDRRREVRLILAAAAIGFLFKARLSAEDHGDIEADRAAERDFIETLRRCPIAVSTAEANIMRPYLEALS
jgi:hypothetical protein